MIRQLVCTNEDSFAIETKRHGASPVFRWPDHFEVRKSEADGDSFDNEQFDTIGSIKGRDREPHFEELNRVL